MAAKPKPSKLPKDFHAQLALLVKDAPEGDQWLHEIKFDGYRIGALIDNGKVRLLSRNGNDWTSRFPTIVAACSRLPVKTALLDGEVAAVLADGRTSFQALQNTFSASSPLPLVFFVFDLLHLDGIAVCELGLEERKRRLKPLIGRGKSEVVRYSDHVIGGGPAFFVRACELGAEGIISKRRDLPYRAGRGGSWLKIKCIKRQELVIGGFTEPQGSRAGLGALLVGYFEAGELRFAGKVGTGFTNQSATQLRRQLEAIEESSCPFTPRPAGALARVAHWVKPKLVAEIAFSEWTDDGKIRHPSFQGLRADKRAKDVVREMPV